MFPFKQEVVFLFSLQILWKLTNFHSIDSHLFKKTCFTRVLTVFVLLTVPWEKECKGTTKGEWQNWESQVVWVSVVHLHFFPRGSLSKRERASILLLHGPLTVSFYLQEDVTYNPIISCLACCHKHSVVCVLAETLVRNKFQFLISPYEIMCIINKTAGEDEKVKS